MMIYNQLCIRHHDTGHLNLLKLQVFSLRCDLLIKITADCTHNEIYQTCKYDYSEEIAYCTKPEIGNRPQVRIVSAYFNDNYKIKKNTSMNVNRSQNMGIYYIISLEQNQGP